MTPYEKRMTERWKDNDDSRLEKIQQKIEEEMKKEAYAKCYELSEKEREADRLFTILCERGLL